MLLDSSKVLNVTKTLLIITLGLGCALCAPTHAMAAQHKTASKKAAPSIAELKKAYEAKLEALKKESEQRMRSLQASLESEAAARKDAETKLAASQDALASSVKAKDDALAQARAESSDKIISLQATVDQLNTINSGLKSQMAAAQADKDELVRANNSLVDELRASRQNARAEVEGARQEIDRQRGFREEAEKALERNRTNLDDALSALKAERIEHKAVSDKLREAELKISVLQGEHPTPKPNPGPNLALAEFSTAFDAFVGLEVNANESLRLAEYSRKLDEVSRDGLVEKCPEGEAKKELVKALKAFEEGERVWRYEQNPSGPVEAIEAILARYGAPERIFSRELGDGKERNTSEPNQEMTRHKIWFSFVMGSAKRHLNKAAAAILKRSSQ